MKDIEKMSIDDKIEYWHTHETGNSLREFLGMTEQEYLEFCLPNANLILDNVAGGVMDREKQIKEMAKVIDESHWRIEQDFTGCHINGTEIAEHLYEQGYRKQSEVVKEIFDAIKEKLIFNTYGIATISNKTFCELKKKYTGEKEDEQIH